MNTGTSISNPITANGVMAMNHLAKKAGFLFNVTVTPRLMDRVFIANGKYTVDQCLNVFLRICAEQVKIAFTDNKGWERIRIFYPMWNIDDSFTPEEVIIKTTTTEVIIMLASEETFLQ